MYQLLDYSFSHTNYTNKINSTKRKFCESKGRHLFQKEMTMLLPRTGHTLTQSISPHQFFLLASVEQRNQSWGFGPYWTLPERARRELRSKTLEWSCPRETTMVLPSRPRGKPNVLCRRKTGGWQGAT